MENDSKRIALGSVTFRTYLSQITELCPELDIANRVLAATMLTHAETLAALLAVAFRPQPMIDPRLLRHPQ